jgi:threonine/homoserine/homoserine lactone efflux protein
LIYAALTLFGLSVLILRFAWLGDTIRVVGGAYLVWLGIQAWRARPGSPSCPAPEPVRDVTSLLRGLRVGFLTEITNPKGIAFFLGLFAAAVPPATPFWAKLAVLSAGGMIELAWYTTVSFALSSGPMLTGYQKIRRTVDRVIGTLLIAIGLKVALDARWAGPTIAYRAEGCRWASGQSAGSLHRLFNRGDLSVELFAPHEVDTQQPHEQDEIYIVAAGVSIFCRGDRSMSAVRGKADFVWSLADVAF